MNGDDAIIYLRREPKDIPIKYPHKIHIRNNGKNLYVTHPTEDICAINIPLPKKAVVSNLHYNYLATDSILKSVNIHPGDELNVFGYPLGYQANNAGFPILRSGKLASYPIFPSSRYSTFLLDMNVFPGNSGGPVVFFEKSRYFKNKINFIVGIVSSEATHKQHIKTINEEKIVTTKLSIANIIHAKYIKETIELLKR